MASVDERNARRDRHEECDLVKPSAKAGPRRPTLLDLHRPRTLAGGRFSRVARARVVVQFESRPARRALPRAVRGYVGHMAKRKSKGTGRDYTDTGGSGGPPGKKQKRKVRRNNKGNRA